MASILNVDQIRNAAGTSAMTIDSSGRVNTPAQPHYVGVNTASAIDTNSESTFTTVVHLSTQINTGGHMNTSTGEFTCPVAGNYFVSTHFLTRAAGGHNILIEKNGVTWDKARDIVASGSEQHTGCATVVNCSVNDVLRIRVSNAAGSDFWSDYSGTTIYFLG